MALNVAENFTDKNGFSDSLVDYYIENSHVRLMGCGMRTVTPAKISSFLLPAFLAVFYSKGSVEIRHGSETVLLKPGSFYIFRPYDVYSGKRIGDEMPCFSYLQFDITPFMERYNFGMSMMNSADSVFDSDRYRRFGLILEEYAKEQDRKAGQSGILRQLVKLILAQLIYDRSDQESVPSKPKKGHSSQVINCAFQYTADHLSEPIRIKDILQDENVSKTVLEKTFRRVLNTTPQRALLRFKIERSMEMLQYSSSLGGIAKALGFSSVYHYSNAFQKITGMRPTAYRKELASRQNQA